MPSQQGLLSCVSLLRDGSMFTQTGVHQAGQPVRNGCRYLGVIMLVS
jgi:hypothetical protein